MDEIGPRNGHVVETVRAPGAPASAGGPQLRGQGGKPGGQRGMSNAGGMRPPTMK